MTGQLAFDLPVRAARGRGDFFAAPSNAVALAAVEEWSAWPDRRMLLVGPEGAGKSHLVQVWADNCAGARIVSGDNVPRADIGALASGALAVDDADTVAGDAAGETALFHLHNLMGSRGHPLLLTAARPPSLWPTRLPDLASRMQAMALARIEPPCDALLSAVLVKLFADRQIAVAPAVISWLPLRIERSLAAAARVVARLDAAALAQGRAVTVPFAAQVLDSAASNGDDMPPPAEDRA